jgi:hypothetical protein
VTSITVSATYDAAPSVVWGELRRIEHHVEWMHDAVAITYLGDQREGVGTTFRCDTRVGPFRTADVMTITEWIENTSMGVRHRGLITGEGRFVLRPAGPATEVTWHEVLHFPWWLTGPIGAEAAKPVLRAIWRRNLDLLGRQLAR